MADHVKYLAYPGPFAGVTNDCITAKECEIVLRADGSEVESTRDSLRAEHRLPGG